MGPLELPRRTADFHWLILLDSNCESTPWKQRLRGADRTILRERRTVKIAGSGRKSLRRLKALLGPAIFRAPIRRRHADPRTFPCVGGAAGCCCHVSDGGSTCWAKPLRAAPGSVEAAAMNALPAACRPATPFLEQGPIDASTSAAAKTVV